MKRSDITALKELKKLRDQGVLTEAEFSKKKRAVLGLRGDETVPVTRSTLRLVLLTIVTLGFYPVHLFFEMRRALNKDLKTPRTPLLQAILFVIPAVTVYPLWRFARDLKGLHRKVRRPWPVGGRFEWLLLGLFGVFGGLGFATGYWDDPADIPPALWIGALITLPFAFGYFIRLLWSFNDYWRAKLGDLATSARLLPDLLWSYVWLLGVVVVFGAVLAGVFSALVAAGILSESEFGTPKLDACYERLDAKGAKVDSLTYSIADLRQAGNDREAAALQSSLDRASAEYGRIDAECRQLESEAFGF